MHIALLLISGLLGCCIGSFTLLACLRFSPQKSTKSWLIAVCIARSKCPHCQHILSIKCLLPCLSWLWQQGRCCYCNKRIAWYYFVFELVMGISFTCLSSYYHLSTALLILMLLLSYFILIAYIDIRFYYLPDILTIPLLIAGLLVAYCNIGTISLPNSIVGILCGYLLLWLPATIYHHYRGKIGLGGGDIKLLSALGSWIDYLLLPYLLLIACLVGFLYFAIRNGYAYLCLRCNVTIIPFGPCLLAAAYLILLQQLSVN